MVEVEDQTIGERAVIELLVSPPKLFVEVVMYPASFAHWEMEVVAKFAVVRPVEVERNAVLVNAFVPKEDVLNVSAALVVVVERGAAAGMPTGEKPPVVSFGKETSLPSSGTMPRSLAGLTSAPGAGIGIGLRGPPS